MIKTPLQNKVAWDTFGAIYKWIKISLKDLGKKELIALSQLSLGVPK